MTNADKLEADLGKLDAYNALWSGDKANRDLLLTLTSMQVAEIKRVGDAAKWGPTQGDKTSLEVYLAANSLGLIYLQKGSFPPAFTDGLIAYLDKVRDEPNSGTWAPGSPSFDFTALAVLVKRAEPRYLRALISARSKAHLGYGWQTHKEPPAWPWINEERAAFERLALLDDLTPGESARLQALQGTK